MGIILHITSQATWEAARAAGSYQADTLATEGFIHCSTPTQVIGVANARFRGQAGLALLCIEETRVRAEVRYEDCDETGQQFPHIYGPLNLDAVTQALPFPPQADGTFTLPSLAPSQQGDEAA
ncbi:MAG TPA: DUF952 domain-containing protein [Anaerolineae bacterium]|nr:DUF952 domain-containing protein [Anaerolineae bacterium]